MTAADPTWENAPPAFRALVVSLEFEAIKWAQGNHGWPPAARLALWRWHREDREKLAKAAWTAALGGDTYGFEEWYHADA